MTNNDDSSSHTSTLQEEDIDDISCQTGVTTLLATNARRRVTISPTKMMNAQRVVERYDAILRGIVAELLWLVSARKDPALAVNRRRHIVQWLSFYTDSTNVALHDDIYAMVQIFGNTPMSFLSGNLVSNLLNTLNTKEPGTNVFTQRLILHSLLRDILAVPPEETTFIDQESLSDLTCQNGGVTAVKEKTRVVVHGHPAEQDFVAVQIQVDPALQQAPMREDSDSFTGGYPFSEATPQDEPSPEDRIVASFRAGNFELLRTTHEPEVLIAALSSSIAVMHSLLTIDDSATPNTQAAHWNSTSADECSHNPEGSAVGMGETVV